MKTILLSLVLIVTSVFGSRAQTPSFYIHNETGCDFVIQKVYYVCVGTCSPVFEWVPNVGNDTGPGCSMPCPFGLSTPIYNDIVSGGNWVWQAPACPDIQPVGYEFLLCDDGNNTAKVWDPNCFSGGTPQSVQTECECFNPDPSPGSMQRVNVTFVRIPQTVPAGAPDIFVCRVHH